jgi:non-heme chloroperoxidase
MICKRTIAGLLVILTYIFNQPAKAQMELNDQLEQFLIPSVIPSYTLKAIQLTSGIHLEYVEKGTSSGVPVIFLHGFTDSWLSYDQVLPLLPESIHAYVLSQRGHGNSDRPAKGYKPEDFSRDLADFMRELKLESAIIVGHSLGATIAQRFALDYPQMTKALILESSFASFRNNPNVAELKGIISKIEDPIDSGFVHEFQKSTLIKPVAAASANTYVHESMKVPARIWKAVVEEAMDADYLNSLNEISIPTLILWGDKDLFCPKGDQDVLQTSIKKSTLLIYEGVGHGIHWEEPEKFTKDVVDFINRIRENNIITSEMNLMENTPPVHF